MNLQGLIEFNKYTLAIAAGCMIYALETFVPAERPVERYLVLALLVVLLVCSVFGILLFAACTKALHAGASANIDKRIETLGTRHAVLLVVGIVGLAAMMVPRILTAPTPAPAACICAAPAPTQR